MAAGKYPTPEQLELPTPDRISPDQAFYLSYKAWWNRIWLFSAFQVLINATLAGALLFQEKKHEPIVEYVELNSGLPVVVGKDVITIGSDTYSPAQIKAVVTSFIEHRFAYDWQKLDKYKNALSLMSEPARAQELSKMKETLVLNRVLAERAMFRIQLDHTKFSVTSLRPGVFKVEIKGVAYINNAITHTDPTAPFPKDITLSFEVEKIEPNDINPLGYQIIRSDNEIY